MTVSISYTIGSTTNFTPVTGDVANPALAGLGNGGIVVVGDNGVNTSNGQYLNATLGQTGLTAPLSGTDAAVAQLTNGNVVIVTEDADSIVYRIQDTSGNPMLGFTDIGDLASTNADVAALQNGGFVIVNEDDFGAPGGDVDIDLRFYNAAGVLQPGAVSIAPVDRDLNPAVAVLDNGNVVVTWQRVDGGSTEIRAAIYTQTGVVVQSDFLVDTTGSINREPQVVATSNGGFALFYEDNGWGTGGTDITMARYNSAGTFQGFNNLSNPNNAASTRDERNVQVTRLADGNLAIAYEHDSFFDQDVVMRVLRDDGSALSGEVTIDGASSVVADQTAPDLAMLGRSGVAVVVDGSDTGLEGESRTIRVVHTSDGADDLLSGGQMFDDFYGGAGTDTVAYLDATSGVTASLATGGTGGDATGDTYSGIESLWGSNQGDSLTGDGGANYLKGAGGDDTLFGGAGADQLDGGTGADTMNGGLGNDFYYVDNVGDVIQGEIGYASGGGIDTVRTFVNNYVAPDNIELVRITNITDTDNYNATGNDAPGTLVGNAGNNTLNGRGGNDQINGNNGDDVLIGGEGRDTLVGGNGEDTFVYTSVSNSRAGSANRDVINGFSRGPGTQDIIDLSGVDANSVGGTANDAFVFLGSAAFDGFGSVSAGQLRMQSLGGPNAVLIEGDVNGDGVADMQIFVNLTTYMTGTDFIL